MKRMAMKHQITIDSKILEYHEQKNAHTAQYVYNAVIKQYTLWSVDHPNEPIVVLGHD
jgi:hypothetical protein